MPIVELLSNFAIPFPRDGVVEYAAFEGTPINVGVVIAAWILIVLFGAVSFVTAVIAVDVEGSFGMTHGRSEVLVLVLKLVLILLDHVQRVVDPLFVLAKPIIASIMLYQILLMFPYNSQASNQFRCGAFALFLWASICETCRVLGLSLDASGDLLLVGAGPAAYLGWLLAYRRWFLVTSRMPKVSKMYHIITTGGRHAEAGLVSRLGLDAAGESDVDIMVRHVMRRTDSAFVGLERSTDQSNRQFSLLSLLGITLTANHDEDAGFNESDEEDDDDDELLSQQQQASEAGSVAASGIETSTVVQIAEESRRRWRREKKRGLVMQWLYSHAARHLQEKGLFWLSMLNVHHFFGQALPVRMSASAAAKINMLDIRYCFFRYLFERRRQQLANGVGTVRYLDLSKSLRSAQHYHRIAMEEL